MPVITLFETDNGDTFVQGLAAEPPSGIGQVHRVLVRDVNRHVTTHPQPKGEHTLRNGRVKVILNTNSVSSSGRINIVVIGINDDDNNESIWRRSTPASILQEVTEVYQQIIS